MNQTGNLDLASHFHIAKLSLFTVRLLNFFEHKKEENEQIKRMIEYCANKDAVQLPVSLMNQATFLQFSYVCLVWLWERCKQEGIEKEIIDGLEKYFCFSNCRKLSGPRNLSCAKDYLRLIRNAISHGRVKITDESFEFSDQDARRENDRTIVSLSWEDVGRLTEAVLFSVNDYIYNP